MVYSHMNGQTIVKIHQLLTIYQGVHITFFKTIWISDMAVKVFEPLSNAQISYKLNTVWSRIQKVSEFQIICKQDLFTPIEYWASSVFEECLCHHYTLSGIPGGEPPSCEATRQPTIYTKYMCECSDFGHLVFRWTLLTLFLDLKWFYR